MGNGRTILSLVQADGFWRVQITWANGSEHLFGKFGTKEEAERWIAEHLRFSPCSRISQMRADARLVDVGRRLAGKAEPHQKV
jgi:hypothetical protein